MFKSILVIEDDLTIHQLLEEALSSSNYNLEPAYDGLTGLERARAGSYELVILDVKLPVMDGFTVCAKLREEDPFLPIMMLTSQTEVSDKVEGLGSGADDYVTKPFDPTELRARIEALLRRSAFSRASAAKVLNYGPMEIEVLSRRVTINGKQIELTLKEFDILLFLALRPGSIYSRRDLMQELWGMSAADFEPTVTVHLSRLRSKIEGLGPSFIETVHGQGYRFVFPQECHS